MGLATVRSPGRSRKRFPRFESKKYLRREWKSLEYGSHSCHYRCFRSTFPGWNTSSFLNDARSIPNQSLPGWTSRRSRKESPDFRPVRIDHCEIAAKHSSTPLFEFPGIEGRFDSTAKGIDRRLVCTLASVQGEWTSHEPS